MANEPASMLAFWSLHQRLQEGHAVIVCRSCEVLNSDFYSKRFWLRFRSGSKMGSSRIGERRVGIFWSGSTKRAERKDERIANRERQRLSRARKKEIVAEQPMFD
jgi:hypothetical protein